MSEVIVSSTKSRDPKTKASEAPANDPRSHPDSSAPSRHSGAISATDNQNDSAKNSSEEPVDSKIRKKAEQSLRNQYAVEIQKDLWRQGMEMSVPARGTNLVVKYILAGEAFKFQFQETIIANNQEQLKALGFTRVELTNGDDIDTI